MGMVKLAVRLGWIREIEQEQVYDGIHESILTKAVRIGESINV